MAMAAIAAVGVGVSVYGIVQQSKARKEYEERQAESGDPLNPYNNLQVSTLGSQYKGAQALRSEATQMNLLSKSGSRGLAYVPQVARQTSLVAQSEAANLDMQRKRIDQLKAGGEMYVQNIQEARLNQDLAGSAQQFATGQQNMAGGINLASGALASGFSQGGEFSQYGQQNQQLQPYAIGASSYAPQPVGAQGPGFQPLTPQQLIQ